MKTYNISFDAIGDRLFNFVCSLYQSDQRFPYPLQKGQQGSLFGTAFATYIAHMLDRVQELPGHRDIEQEFINLRDPETGLFHHPGLNSKHFLNPQHHSELYVQLQTTYFAHACLHALGVYFDRRVFWMKFLLRPGALSEWLDNLDWKNPWLVSNIDMFVGAFLLEWQQQERENILIANALREYFEWHNKMQDEKTGYWGTGASLFNAMAGAYHIFTHYDYAKRKIKFAKAIIDSTLQLVNRDGLFVYGGGGGSCEDMDAVDILIRMSNQTNYRQDEIKAVLLRVAASLGVAQNIDGGFSWRLLPRPANLAKRLIRYGLKFCYLRDEIYRFVYMLLHLSHYRSIHYYSSLSLYPFNIAQYDLWSSWFRPLALGIVAQRYPDEFQHSCVWKIPHWPGLGYFEIS